MPFPCLAGSSARASGFRAQVPIVLLDLSRFVRSYSRHLLAQCAFVTTPFWRPFVSFFVSWCSRIAFRHQLRFFYTFSFSLHDIKFGLKFVKPPTESRNKGRCSQATLGMSRNLDP